MWVLGIKLRLSNLVVGTFRNNYVAWIYAGNVPKGNTWICCSAGTMLKGPWCTGQWDTAAITTTSDPWFVCSSCWLSNLNHVLCYEACYGGVYTNLSLIPKQYNHLFIKNKLSRAHWNIWENICMLYTNITPFEVHTCRAWYPHGIPEQTSQ